MTAKPRREPRDPLARRQEKHVPPGARSRAMQAMSARAATGRFVLQTCVNCQTVTYPPRDVCPKCWNELVWADQVRGATVLSETTIRVTTDLYFRDHLPWRMGKVALDAGPVALAHLHQDLKPGDPAEMHLLLDKRGNAALFATPSGGAFDMSDPQWREFVVSVRDSTVLVSDGSSAVGRAIVSALRAAGAGSIIAGSPQPSRAPQSSDAFASIEGVRSVRLDLTDARSITECLTGIGGPLDIVVNTARFMRSGGITAGRLLDQKRALEIGVVGFMRLAQASAPLLRTRRASAFVDILSIHALAAEAGFAGYSAAEAARLSLVQSFRHEMRAEGVRVVSVFAGPIDDEDHQSVPLPKLAPARLAQGVIEAIEKGREQLCVGDAAQDAMDRWFDDPALYIREKNA